VGFLLLLGVKNKKKTFVKERERNTYRLWVEKSKRKRPLGRPRCRWEDIRMDINETIGRRELDSSCSG
jgi:hypothetical protein